MGKKPSRPSRHTRRKQQRLDRGFTLTVGAAPTSRRASGAVALHNELRLVRSSLLYADRVDLIAPAASLLWTFAPLRGLDPDNVWETVADLPPEALQRLGVEESEVPLPVFRQMMRSLGRRSAMDPKRVEGERLWRPAIQEILRGVEETFGGAEAPELELALDTGDVRLLDTGKQLEDPVHQQVAGFRHRISEALDNPSGTVLFDQLTTSIIREDGSLREKFSPVGKSRSRRAATGTGLVEWLPVFPDAPMSSVLEAREELADGRAKYRASVKALSVELQSSALDETLPSDIEELWRDEIRPTLVDIRKTVKGSRIAKETGLRLATEGYGIPTIAVTLTSLSSVADLLPTSAAAMAASLRIAAAGAREAVEARAAKKKHELVYLLDLNKKLGNFGLE